MQNRYINLRYLRLKLLKNKENNKNICHIFIITSKIIIPCYVMSEVSLKWFYFALFADGLTLYILILAFICFASKLFIIWSPCTLPTLYYIPKTIMFCSLISFYADVICKNSAMACNWLSITTKRLLLTMASPQTSAAVGKRRHLCVSVTFRRDYCVIRLNDFVWCVLVN